MTDLELVCEQMMLGMGRGETGRGVGRGAWMNVGASQKSAK
jgi:hypothetical protein